MPVDRPSREELLRAAAEVRRTPAELRRDAALACELARLRLRSLRRIQPLGPPRAVDGTVVHPPHHGEVGAAAAAIAIAITGVRGGRS